MKKNIELDKEECELSEVQTFVEEIANCLLKKSAKNDCLKFDVDIEENVPKKIFTDEVRIKQVLINLISNSIKFTSQGKVSLNIFKRDSELVF